MKIIPTKDNELTLAEKNELKLIQLIKHVKVDFIEIGSLLLENSNKAYWSMNGHESFKSYIEMLGIGSYSWATRLMAIAAVVSHNILTEDEVLEIGVGKMALLLPRLKEGKVDIDTIELSKSCSTYDLRVVLGKATDGELSEEWLLCPRCGVHITFDKSMLRK